MYTKTAKAANRERWNTTIDPVIKARLFTAAAIEDMAVNEYLEHLLSEILPAVPEMPYRIKRSA